MALNCRQNGEEQLRERLQLLLDDKEKQLQLAGTLGQRILAQQMELEDRINQLPLSSSLAQTVDQHLQEDVQEKLKELEEVLAVWGKENASVFSILASQTASTKLEASDSVSLFPEPSPIHGQNAPSGNQTTAIQSSRRAKNAAHRADDVEFAFEIGSGLLTEVRRLQSLLGERDKAIQDMKEEKDDLERSNVSLKNNLQVQEQSTDKFKEENWNLEVTLQELRSQAAELQGSNLRLESEQKRLTKQLSQVREVTDRVKAENDVLNASLADLKAKHETDIAQMRRNAASLQRDKSDLQAALEGLKAEAEKKSRTLRTLGSQHFISAMLPFNSSPDDGTQAENGIDSQAAGFNPHFPSMHVAVHDDLDFGDYPLSLLQDQNKGRSEELESLKRNFLHAQRQIASLKNSLMKEKELRLEQKKKRSVPTTGYGDLIFSAEDDGSEDWGEGEEEGGNSKFIPQTNGRRRSRPRRPKRRLISQAEGSFKKYTSTSSLEDASGESSTKQILSSEVPEQVGLLLPTLSSGKRTYSSIECHDMDPAFVSTSIDQKAIFGSPSSVGNDNSASEKPVPSHLAQELGIGKSDVENSHYSLVDQIPLHTSPGSLSGKWKQSNLQAVDSTSSLEKTFKDASVATVEVVSLEVACQTERQTSSKITGYQDVTRSEIMDRIQKCDTATQTVSLDPYSQRSQGIPVMLTAGSLPFRFISPVMQGSTTVHPVQMPRSEAPCGSQSTNNGVASISDTGVLAIDAGSQDPSNSVDKSLPPTIALPPPPKAPPPPSVPSTSKGNISSQVMPPPSKIPERRASGPARPLSPPPRELIQRATTPLSTRATLSASRQSHEQSLMTLESSNDRRSERSMKIQEAVLHTHHQSSSTSVVSEVHSSNHSRRSSVSSQFNVRRDTTLLGSSLPTSRGQRGSLNGVTGATDPNIIHAITQTMIGEFLYKYTRRTIGKGYGEKRHKRYFWVHPYTKTIYWSSSDPSAVGVAESNAKSAFIESVRSVLDPNPLPPGIYQYSVVVSTPQREMKFTAPSKERHDIWITALNFLLARPTNLPHSPEIGRTDRKDSSVLVHGSSNKAENSGLLSSPRSGRTFASSYGSDTWNITPRAHHPASNTLSPIGSVRKRPGTPAAEYMRWDAIGSPDRDYEQISVQPGEADYDFEIHDEVKCDGDFDGLENVRTCCDGAHTIGKHHLGDHLHFVETRVDDSRGSSSNRPVSPSGWSFKSRAGSARVREGGNLFGRSRNG